MTFQEFHEFIHQKGFLIVCLNDYKFKGEVHTFISVQDKKGHGYHSEGLSKNVAKVYQELVTKIEK